MIEIQSIKLFPKQTDIKNKVLNNNSKYSILQSSRQAGKSTLCVQLICYWAINCGSNQELLYVTPQYNLSKVVFNKIVEGLNFTGVIKSFSRQDLIITFHNNSKLYFKSGNNADSIRGMSVDYAIIDEASYIADDVYQKIIRPTLNVRGKKVLLVSTPRGKHTMFHTLCNLGKSEDPNYQHFFMSYTDNKFYDLKEVEDARRTLPKNIFIQEYLGQFVENGGSVFTNIENITMSNWGNKTPTLFAGLDLGKQDWTVLTIINENGEVVYIESIRQENWNVMIDKIIKTLKRYNPWTIVEVNGVGDPVYDRIHKEYKKTIPFLTTNESKQEIIEDLILAINDAKIKIPDVNLYPQLYNELESFTYDYSPKSRKIKYGAPSGLHDDHCMSLAFGNHAIKSRQKNRVKFKVI